MTGLTRMFRAHVAHHLVQSLTECVDLLSAHAHGNSDIHVTRGRRVRVTAVRTEVHVANACCVCRVRIVHPDQCLHTHALAHAHTYRTPEHCRWNSIEPSCVTSKSFIRSKLLSDIAASENVARVSSTNICYRMIFDWWQCRALVRQTLEHKRPVWCVHK